MTSVTRLIRIDFDNLENSGSDAVTENLLATFSDDGEKTAHRKVNEWLANYPPVKLYQGWDEKIYPKFVIKQERVL